MKFKINKEKLDKTVGNIRMKAETYDKLAKIAHINDTNMTTIIRQMIEYCIDEMEVI